MLERYPLQKDQKNVRFSDEVYFAFGPQERQYVTRKLGERHCVDCIQYAQELQPKDKHKAHAWAAISFNFKSELIQYDIPSNINGKITAQVYRDEILENYVKNWLKDSDFVLEEDYNGSYSILKDRKGIVQQQKRENNL